MTKRRVLALDTDTPQVLVPQTASGDVYEMPVTLKAATGNEVALTLDYTTNKAAGDDTGLVVNQTDTASPGTSLLADFQVGGVSKFKVDNAGGITASTLTCAWIKGNSSVLAPYYLGVGSAVTRLYSDAAHQLDQRNSTNAQTFNIYNTYTDASNYERGFLRWDSDVLTLGTEAGGTGVVRDIAIPNKVTLSSAPPGGGLWFGDGDTGISESADDALKVTIGYTGRFIFEADAFSSVLAGGPRISRGIGSATVPVFMPNNNDRNTGIGWVAADQLSLIAGATEGIRVTTTATETKGGRIRNITTVAAATYDLLATDDILDVTYTSTGAVAVTLPTAQVVAGRTIVVKDAGGGAASYNITIDTEGSETIDGAATAVISTNYAAVTIYCDGTNWMVI
ncbi:MAG: hypothetical protein GY696_25130 [Gammaproteobacteria bacterium]|nr:hypothetical protein [Gammaproteobacteria bacterium]